MKFKVGDKVKRIEGQHMGMGIGDTDIVTKIYDETTFYLTKYIGGHSPRKFVKCEGKVYKLMKELMG